MQSKTGPRKSCLIVSYWKTFHNALLGSSKYLSSNLSRDLAVTYPCPSGIRTDGADSKVDALSECHFETSIRAFSSLLPSGDRVRTPRIPDYTSAAPSDPSRSAKSQMARAMLSRHRVLPGQQLTPEFETYRFLTSKDHDSCNPVLQFPDIARPLPLLECPQDLEAKTRLWPAKIARKFLQQILTKQRDVFLSFAKGQ